MPKPSGHSLEPPASQPADDATGALTAKRLRSWVERMKDQPVLVVADLVLDRFLYAEPRRVSREAPVLILQHEREEAALGGGANAIANLHSLGGRPLPIGRIGTDELGRRLMTEIEAKNLEVAGIYRDPEFTTPSKTRVLAGAPNTRKQQVMRYDRGTPQLLDDRALEALSERIAGQAGRASVAVFSDYGYGAVDPRLLPVVRQAIGADGVVVVDSRYDLLHFEGLDGASPNLDEAEAAHGERLATEKALAAAGPVLLERLGGRFLLITRGSAGMVLFQKGQPAAFLPAFGSHAVTDVTGAGDTVIATLSLALAAGANPIAAATLANIAGGLVVAKPGTATVSAEEIDLAIGTEDGAQLLATMAGKRNGAPES